MNEALHQIRRLLNVLDFNVDKQGGWGKVSPREVEERDPTIA
jgi:hypothetical protein